MKDMKDYLKEKMSEVRIEHVKEKINKMMKTIREKISHFATIYDRMGVSDITIENIKSISTLRDDWWEIEMNLIDLERLHFRLESELNYDVASCNRCRYYTTAHNDRWCKLGNSIHHKANCDKYEYKYERG